MRSLFSRALLAASLLLAACSTNVDATNPYDPDSASPQPGTVVGRVIAQGRLSAEGIRVFVELGSDEIVHGDTGADGTFLIASVPPGRYNVSIREEGFYEARLFRIEVAIGDTVDLGDITLQSLAAGSDASTLTGTATFEGLTEHGGILVVARGTTFRSVTGPDGSWVLTVAEGTYTLDFSAPEWVTESRADVTVARGKTATVDPVTLLQNPATITGVVKRRSCTPDPVDEVVVAAEGALVSAIGSGATAVVDSEGKFTLTGLPGGVWAVRATLDGQDRQDSLPVPVRGGATAALVEELVLPASRGSVVGHVLLTDRVDHSGTVVQVTGVPGLDAFTAQNGAFRIPNVCAGEGYEVSARPTQEGFSPDRRGGISVESGADSVPVEMVLSPQLGGLDLAAGAEAVRELRISYALAAAPGTTEMRIAQQEFADATSDWEPYRDSGFVDLLPATDGSHTVFAQVRGGGAVSAVFRDNVVVDRVPPSAPTVVIEGGSDYSNDPDGAVTLTLTASDTPVAPVDHTSGLLSMKLLNRDLQGGAPAPSDPQDPSWDDPVLVPVLPYLRTYDHPLLRPNFDEQKELWVRFGDAAGNWSAPISRSVILDREAPDGAAVDIVTTTPGFTDASRIDLLLTVADENPNLQVRISGSSTFVGAVLQPVPEPPTVSWNLPQVDGPQTVWVQYADVAGNLGPALSATIVLDRVAPAGVRMSIDQAPYSPTTDLDLTLAAQGAAEMVFSLQPDFTDSAGAPESWVPFAGAYAVTLPAADGPHVVYGKFRDAAHNESIALAATVTLDRSAPAVAALELLEGSVVSSAAVNLAITALPGPLDAYELRVDVQNTPPLGPVTTGSWQPFNPAVPVTLPAPDGAKELQVFVRDAAGNVSPLPARAAVTLDATPPMLVAVEIDGAVPWTNDPQVLLGIDTVGADQVLISNRGDFAGSTWQPLTDPSVAWTLPATDGTHTVFVRVRDLAGNEVSGSAQIGLDLTGPQPASVTIEGGASFTSDTVVDLVLSASDALSGVVSAEVDTEGSFTGAAGVVWLGAASQPLAAFPLDPQEGAQTVHVRFHDAAGNVSLATATIRVDTQNPDGALAINGGAAFSQAAAVTLTLSAPADATQVKLVDGAVASCAAPLQPFAPSVAWTLPAGDGSKSISVCFVDGAGNSSTASASIVLDTQNPSGTLAVNGGATHTVGRTVTLTLTSAADVTSMAIANAAVLDCSTAAYEPFATPRTWSLTAGDGTKNLAACFRDGSGRTATATTTISLDGTAPTGSVSIDAGATTSRDSVVDLTLAAADAGGSGVSFADVANDPSYSSAQHVIWAGGASQPLAGFALIAGDGPRTVYVRFTDLAGNQLQTAATVVVDSAPPAGTIAISGGALYTQAAGVTLTLTAPADTTEMRIVDGAAPSCAARVAYQASSAWTLPAGDGAKSVSVCYADAAGNTATATATITLDTVNPTGTLSIDSAAAFSRDRDVVLVLTAAADVTGLAFADGAAPACASATYESVVAQRAWQLPTTDGAKTVGVCFRDAAGRTGTATDSIVLDGTAPAPVTVTVAGGAAYASAASVAVLVAAADATAGLATYELSLDPNFTGAVVTAWPGGASVNVPAFPLAATQGLQTVYTRVVDAAGNLTIASDAISLDTQDPVGTVLINGGAAYVTAIGVTLTLTAPADTVSYKAVNGAVASCAAPLSAYAATAPHTLVAGDGSKTVSVCYVDSAGRTATTSATTTLDTTSPAGTITIEPVGAYTRTSTVNLRLTAAATEMAILDGGVPPCGAALYEPFAPTKSWTLPGADGAKTVGVCFRDAAGLTASNTASITLDATTPTVAVSIDSAATFSPDTSVAVGLTFPNDVAGYALASNSLDCSTATYTAVPGGSVSATIPAFAIPTGDGTKVVVACVRDNAGNTGSGSDSIVLDTVAPIGASILVDGGALWTQDRDVVLTLTAPADTTEMRIVDGAVASCAARVGFAGTPPWTVPVGDGLKTISVCFADAAGNTATATATVTLDTVNPAGSISIDGAASYTRDRDVVLTLAGVSADVTGIAFADGAAPACASASYEALVLQRAWQLPTTDGAKVVGVCFRDAAGRTSSATDSIVLDGTAPAPVTVSVASGAAYATATSVAVLVSAADATAGLSTYELSLDPNFTGATPTAWPGGASVNVPAFTLATTQGLQTVYTRIVDAAGNLTIASDAISLDTQDPVGTVLINGGASYVTAIGVTLTLNAPADTVSYKAVNGAVPSCAAPLSAYAATVPHNLVAGDGGKTVSVCYVDSAGRTSTTSASTTLDTTSPAGTITIEPAGAYTRTSTINLRLTAAATEMSIADGGAPACASATYEPYAPTKAWTLPGADGAKIIGVCFRDAAGLTASNTASVTLDSTPPTVVVSIDGAATFSRDTTVAVGLTFPNDVAGYALASDTLDCTTASYTTVPGGSVSASNPAVAIPSGDGTKVVVACVRDNAGNTGSASDSIVLDSEAPGAGSIQLAGGAAYTTLGVVPAAIAASGATEMCFEGDVVGSTTDGCVASGWIAFAPAPNVTLSPGDGQKSLNLYFRDGAGNVSPRSFATILRDGTPPFAGAFVVSGPAADASSTTLTRNQSVTAQVVGYGDGMSGVTEMQLSESATFIGASWVPVASDSSFLLSAGDALKTVYLRVRDAAGTPSPAVWASITLDTTPPTAATVTINDDAEYAIQTLATVRFYVDGNARDYSYDGAIFFPCATNPCASTAPGEPLSSTLSLPDGVKTRRLFFRDAAGNVSSPFDDTIILDTTVPATVELLGVDVRTTSIFVDFETAPQSEGVAFYRVRAIEPGKPDITARIIEVNESEGWITGLPALIEYNVQVQTIDHAGNSSVWAPTNPSPVLVGLTTSSIAAPTVGFSGSNRGIVWNGQVLLSGYDNTIGQDYKVVTCDTRREPCSESGFRTLTFDPAPAGAADQAGQNTFFSMRDELWMVGVRDRDTVGTIWTLDAYWTREPDLSGSWVQVTMPDVANPGTMPTSLVASSNGKVAAIAYLSSNAVYVQTCSLKNGCYSTADWSAPVQVSDVVLNPVEAFSKVSIDAGENHLWVSWAASNGTSCIGGSGAINCGVGLAGCTIATSTNGCTAAANWYKLKLVHPQGIPRGARAIEADGKLWVASLFEPGGPTGNPDGLFLWSCPLTQTPDAPQCSAAGSFAGPVLLQELDSPAGGVTSNAPAIAFEAANGSLFYSTYDLTARLASFGRCKPSAGDCMATAGGIPLDWNRSSLYEGDSTVAAPVLGVVGGNPVVVAYRDLGSAYVTEPATWAPVRRALVPDLESGGVRASWIDRAAGNIDGYRVSFDATPPDGTGLDGGAFANTVGLFTPLLDHYELLSTPGGEAQGLVGSVNGLDQSIGEPLLQARGARHMAYATSSVAADGVESDGQPRFAWNAACYAVAFVDAGRNVKVATCDRTRDCASQSNWNERTIEPYDGIGRVNDDLRDLAIALEPANARLHIAYAFDDSPYDLNYEFRTIGGGCAVSAVENQIELLDGSLAGNRPGNLALAATDARVFLAYSDDGLDSNFPHPVAANTVLRGCTAADAGGCTNAANWSTVTLATGNFGNALLVSGTELLWAFQHNTDTNGVLPTKVDFLRCDVATRCDLAAELLERHTVITWQGSFQRAANLNLRVEEGRVLLGAGRLVAWCNDVQADCDTGEDWNRLAPSTTPLAFDNVEESMLVSQGNTAGGAIGDLVLLAYDTAGAYVGRCSNRCWDFESWSLGTAFEGSRAYGFAGGGRADGAFGTFVPGTGLVFVARDYNDPTASYGWVFHDGAWIDVQ